MANTNWEKFKIKFAILNESRKTTFVKGKWIYIILASVLGLTVLQLLRQKYSDILPDFIQDDANAGLIGTIIGAVVGSAISWVGSIYVSKYQIKAEAQVKKKDTIYSPLYDELKKNHEKVLSHNLYSQSIFINPEPGLSSSNLEYVVLAKIKMDSRYLALPKTVKQFVHNLEREINGYLLAREKTSKEVEAEFRKIVKQEMNVEFEGRNFEEILLAIYFDKDYDRFASVLRLVRTLKAKDNDTIQRMFDKYIEVCDANRNVMDLLNQKQAWVDAEENMIKLLEEIIKRINAQYQD